MAMTRNEAMDDVFTAWQFSSDPSYDPTRALRERGFAVVPVEPTEAMHDAARDWSQQKYGKAIGKDASGGCYRAMMGAVR